jgi:translation elongation factor EF-G
MFVHFPPTDPQSVPKAGTPFFTMRGYLPAIDSFGFETDLRLATSGLAFPQLVGKV